MALQDQGTSLFFREPRSTRIRRRRSDAAIEAGWYREVRALCGAGDVAIVNLLKNWIDQSPFRGTFLFEAARD